MDDMNQVNLTLTKTIRAILINEVKSVIYEHKGSPFIKFATIALAIEYIGACLDDFPFEDDKQSKKRFNKGLKLLGKKYKPFSKESSNVYFYKDFRCAFVHQLRPEKNIELTHRIEAKVEGTRHLVPLKSGSLVLVLEDFYDDLEKACNKLIRLFDEGKITNRKKDIVYLKITPRRNNE